MAEKKEHHLTRAKRLREEAELAEQGLSENNGNTFKNENFSEWGEITVQDVSNTPIVVSRPYRVFDSRAGLVAQVNSIEEAEAEVKRFPGGTYRMI